MRLAINMTRKGQVSSHLLDVKPSWVIVIYIATLNQLPLPPPRHIVQGAHESHGVIQIKDLKGRSRSSHLPVFSSSLLFTTALRTVEFKLCLN